MYQNYIWDFDGTLYDSYPPLCSICTDWLHQHGIEDPYEQVMKELKITVQHFCEVYGQKTGLGTEGMLKEYREVTRSTPRTLTLFDGAADMLRAVKASNGCNYLYTHRGIDGPEALKTDHLLDLFDGQITREDGFPLKPAPDALIHLVNRYHLDRDQTVMIGDRDIDLLAAKGAGLRTCLFDPDDFYPGYPADHRFKSFAAMQAALIGSSIS